MEISVSNRTVQRTLHKMGYSGHAAKKKPLVSEKNRKNDLNGIVCGECKNEE